MDIEPRFRQTLRFNSYRIVALYVLNEEAVRVVPRQEHIFQHISYSFLFEAQVLGSDYGRIDQVEAECIGTKPVDDLRKREGSYIRTV